MKRFTLALVAAMAITPARAEWNGFEWGMTFEDAKEIALIEVKEFPANPGRRMNHRLTGKITRPTYTSQVDIAFADGRLEVLLVTPMDDASAYSMATLMRDQYDRPLSERSLKTIVNDCPRTILHWRDDRRGNNVHVILEDCTGESERVRSVTYAPIRSAAETGL